MTSLPLIALDGPSGVGKSTTARAVAAALGWDYLDTGGMYRCAALAALRAGVEPGDPQTGEVLGRALIEQAGGRFALDGEDVTDLIRSAEITHLASTFSAVRSVREVLVNLQQRIGARGRWVVDGRDIGTVVFPAACCKVFLTASAEARAHRRLLELEAKGQLADFAKVLTDLTERDHRDSTRALAPLRPAEDAHRVDSSDLDLPEVIEIILSLHRAHG
jgi:cytidylate kinase